MDENRFGAALVAEISDALIYCDATGTIQIWNRGAVRIFGFSAAETIGQKLDIIIPANLAERHWHGYRVTMESGHTRYADGQLLSVPAVPKDGTRISVEFTIASLRTATGRWSESRRSCVMQPDRSRKFGRYVRKSLGCKPVGPCKLAVDAQMQDQAIAFVNLQTCTDNRTWHVRSARGMA